MANQQYRRSAGKESATERKCVCGNSYFIYPGEEWKSMCIECWKLQRKRAEEHFKKRYGPDPSPRSTEGLAKEFQDNLKALTQLCHPDKHNGSPMSTRITQWLMSKRMK